MNHHLTIAALFLGACSGAHLPPVPAPSSAPSSSAAKAMRPWTCTTPVGPIVLELPEAHGLPLVGISATVLVSGARITTSCERQHDEAHAPASAAPTAAPDAAVSVAPSAADVGKLAPESQP